MSLIKVAEECAKDSDASKGLQAPLGLRTARECRPLAPAPY
jgi:hypothetical protein